MRCASLIVRPFSPQQFDHVMLILIMPKCHRLPADDAEGSELGRLLAKVPPCCCLAAGHLRVDQKRNSAATHTHTRIWPNIRSCPVGNKIATLALASISGRR
jgi:hypothetical protein